jgi:hypothetical protein
MQVQNDPLVLVLDLEQLLLRKPEELLPLLENHILLIIMGQLRDIKERERLSRGLCREYNELFAENDILVLPRPLSTKQTDARLLAPRKLAHLVGVATSAVNPAEDTETPFADAGSAPAPAPRVWTRFIRLFGFALLVLAALLPVVGVSLTQSPFRSKVALGARAESVLTFGPSTNFNRSWPTTRRAKRPLAEASKRRSRDFVEGRRHRELRELVLDRATRPQASGSQPRSELASKPDLAQLRRDASCSSRVPWARRFKPRPR